MSASQLAQLVCTQSVTIDSLQQQVDGLKHQLERDEERLTLEAPLRYRSGQLSGQTLAILERKQADADQPGPARARSPRDPS